MRGEGSLVHQEPASHHPAWLFHVSLNLTSFIRRSKIHRDQEGTGVCTHEGASKRFAAVLERNFWHRRSVGEGRYLEQRDDETPKCVSAGTTRRLATIFIFPFFQTVLSGKFWSIDSTGRGGDVCMFQPFGLSVIGRSENCSRPGPAGERRERLIFFFYGGGGAREV